MTEIYQNYQAFSSDVLPKLEQVLTTELQRSVSNSKLRAAMSYTLATGGKRFRPLLLLTIVQIFAPQKLSSALKPAAALELVHTYSLIHDDLPAMDNDDYRRGKLANHKKFGEAQAILAGDGLLTLAFQWLAEADLPADIRIQLTQRLSQAAGPSNMVAGQYLDISLSEADTQKTDFEVLQKMERQKTGALLNAAITMGAIIAKVEAPVDKLLDQFGWQFGSAFQIADDIVDAKSGQDVTEDKQTYVSLYGLVDAKNKLSQQIIAAQQTLDQIKVAPTDLIASFLGFLEAIK
ncbi:polyprenyl synthetase family protein [Agrilactobacillus fermenti]|uniref:polyprenyl synthetase family protein n=1 Tax=Agrilactobacillus fermenti TaxID=2586909 RepID=UPI001E2BC88B|nr:farnesyl diphosphate synthase [Agrilactobacillus fermenti]MCD2256210.1 polyprenyl synthetase family protein [Agrilactobacillus fermenti]